MLTSMKVAWSLVLLSAGLWILPIHASSGLALPTDLRLVVTKDNQVQIRYTPQPAQENASTLLLPTYHLETSGDGGRHWTRSTQPVFRATLETAGGLPSSRRRYTTVKRSLTARSQLYRFATSLDKATLFRHTDLSGRDLSGFDLSGYDLTGTKFIEADLSDANLEGAKLTSGFFTGATLDRTNFNKASGENINFQASKGEDTRFTFVIFANPQFGRAFYLRPDFSRSQLEGLAAVDATLYNGLFTLANLTKASFLRTQISYSNFQQASLTHASFSSADLRYSNMDRASATLTDSNGRS